MNYKYARMIYIFSMSYNNLSNKVLNIVDVTLLRHKLTNYVIALLKGIWLI